jgi:hypothetical protein
LFGLPSKFSLQLFLPLGVSGIPSGLVIFDLLFDHGVKDLCDLMGSRHGRSLGAQLGFHSMQVVAQGRKAAMEGMSGHAELQATAKLRNRRYSSNRNQLVCTNC